MKYRYAVIFVMLLCITTISFAQETGSTTTVVMNSRISVMASYAAGNFAIDIPEFNSIYSNRSISKTAAIGLGNNRFYVIGKYREYAAFGRSNVVNIAVEGRADWKQKFYNIGFRLHSDQTPLHLDFLYVISEAEESITTIDPVVQELTAKQLVESKGGAIALGIAIKILGPLKLFGEIDYTVMLKDGSNAQGRSPNLGGASLNGGFLLTL